MFNCIMKSSVTKEYVSASAEVSKYLKLGICPPNDITERHAFAIMDYRTLLDLNDLKMPQAKFPYVEKDEKTWRFLDIVMHGCKPNKKFMHAILNPEWIYLNRLTKKRR